MKKREYNAQLKLLNEVLKGADEATEGVVIPLDDLKKVVRKKKRELRNKLSK